MDARAQPRGVMATAWRVACVLAAAAAQESPTECGDVWFVYEGGPGESCQSSCNPNGPYNCWRANTTLQQSGCMQCDGDNSVVDWALERACDFSTSFVSFINNNCTTCPVCAALTNCSNDVATPYEETPPSFTTDRQCTAQRFRLCDPGEFALPATPTNVSECANYTDCNAEGKYAPAGVTPTTDAVCSADISACEPQEPFELAPPTLTTNRQCTAQRFRTCPAGEYALPATGTAVSECAVYTPCNAQGRWDPAGVTPTSDAVCSRSFTNCLAVNSTWSSVLPTLTSDVRCTHAQPNCTLNQTYETTTPTFTTARVCSADTVCVAGETYQRIPPTLTTDRNCSDVTDCNAEGRWATEPATLTSNIDCDRTFTNCVANGTWFTGELSQTADVSCDEELTTCAAWVTWQSVAPTITSDRVCGNTVTDCLAVNNTWSSAPATPTSDVVCDKQFEACTSTDPYKSGPPTFTSDALCIALCPADYAVAPYAGVGGQSAGVCTPAAKTTTEVPSAVVGTTAAIGGLVVGVAVATLLFRGPWRRGASAADKERAPLLNYEAAPPAARAE